MRKLSYALSVWAVATALVAPAWAQTSSGTLDKIKTTGVVHVAYREASIPFSYLLADGVPTGFGWEVCGKVVEQLKKATGRSDVIVVGHVVTPQNRIPLLQNGTIDLECGSTTNNAERAKQVAFSVNYFYSGTRFLVKASSGIKTADDLKGKKVVSTSGTTNFGLLRKLNADRNLGFELMLTKEHAEAASLLFQGRADAFGMDDILLFGARANAANPSEWAVVGDVMQVDPYAIMLRRDDPEFKKLVDDTLAGLMKSGEFDALYRKWFQSPIPPKGINLNVPMSKELQDNIKALSDKPKV
jgi:glutamate/aspartate transport system substrate-binding protein